MAPVLGWRGKSFRLSNGWGRRKYLPQQNFSGEEKKKGIMITNRNGKRRAKGKGSPKKGDGYRAYRKRVSLSLRGRNAKKREDYVPLD